MLGIRKQTKKWTMRDGGKIRICDMGDAHLLRTIAMLKRLAIKQYYIGIDAGYAMLGMLNGEQAIASIESELIAMEEEQDWTECLPEIFVSLVMDAQRRDLPVGDVWLTEQENDNG